jgi:hypothetical protein
MRDFDAERRQFDREFAAAKRQGKIIALIALPFYVAGVLLVLTILALIAYGLARYLGLA